MTLTPDELRQMRERCEKWLETPGSVRTSAQIMLRLLDALEEKERENESLRYASDKQAVAWKERALKAEAWVACRKGDEHEGPCAE